ncbi:hypothetical protein BDR04DRAFT_1036466 [Suillus decipiens]|nr:hypothetical protein BDR04DRAFT_1036466 [Suillus decipiens]
MACLNLPLDIRYKLENMYLAGIIPGLKQPSLENLNHYICPLINDLVDAWQHGIKFSNTACYPHGRLTHSAVTAVVCDLPTAHHIASMAGVSSHFYCSACNCYHKSTCGRVNFKKWEPRDREKLREYAEQWRDATTSSEHERLFKAHGMHYSELWCLLYWDPSQQLVIDPMHCILEGLVQHHTQNLPGLTSESITSTSPSPAFACDFGEVPGTMTAKELTQISVIRTLLISHIGSGNDQQVEECFDKLKSALSHKNSGPLKFACSSLHCMPQKVGRTLKIDYIKALVNWRRGQPLAAPQKVRSFETAEVLEQIHNVICETTTPTWLGSVPKNFGKASAGTIKADEWRSLITIYLPIALMSLWGASTSHSSDELTVHLRIMLDHTMELVCAVYLACARTMSARRAQAYRSHIAAYVGKLQEIHPTFSLQPNHHASFHIYDYLLLFGPAHLWWCFPFEHLIGIIQCIPINHKFGKLENTMLLSYIKAARLRCWLARPDCPPAIQECGVLFD